MFCLVAIAGSIVYRDNLMNIVVGILSVSAVLVVALLLVARSFKGVIDTRGKRIFLMFAMGILPGFWLVAVTIHDLDAMERVDFCMQCHFMTEYGESLHSMDEDSLVGSHFRNNRISKEYACYDCHAHHEPVTGLIKTKWDGLHEAYMFYLGKPELPIKMIKPYRTETCLRCHEDADNFREMHEDDLEDIVSGKTSCLECHDVTHVLPVKKAEAQ